MEFLRSFGKRPAGKRLERIVQSANYRNGKFQNRLPTQVMRPGVTPFTLAKEFFRKPPGVRPSSPLPSIKTNLFEIEDSTPTLIWFGHSSYLICSRGIRVLVDPVFSGHASPEKHFVTAFPGTDVFKADDFPDIDILVLTHDHYDHLDLDTILKIQGRTRKIVTALGVGAHLQSWGVDAGKITELDWGQGVQFEEGISFRALPARHFSGRGFVRAQTLWMSLVLDIHGKRIYLGGDSGYDAGQFQNAGRAHPGIDLAILECGQYNPNWPQIHMFPEETVLAAADLRAKVLMPVHWAKFALSTHPWNEPAGRLVAAAEKEQQPWIVPMIGQPYILGKGFLQKHWWNVE